MQGDGFDRGARRARLACAAMLAAAVAPGCSKTPEPEASGPRRAGTATAASGASEGGAAAKASAAAAASAAAPTANEISWEAPKAWKQAPNKSAMRLATYTVDRAPGDQEDGELTVSRAGGTIEMNVIRWAEQFEREPDAAQRTERHVGPLKVTIVEIEGRYSGMQMPGMPSTPGKPNWSMLAAIVEGAGTPYFFKLVGPTKTVKGARADFDKLVDSFRAK